MLGSLGDQGARRCRDGTRIEVVGGGLEAQSICVVHVLLWDGVLQLD